MTIAPTPTLDNIAALASEFDISSLCLFNYLISRDQNWIGADCKLSTEFIIVGKPNRSKIAIQYQELYDGELSRFSVRPLSWSSDNRYLYFTTRCCVYEDIYNSNGSLYQFDIEKEIWNILVHAVYEPYYFFSDDGERFVYINQSNNFYDDTEIGMVEILTKKSKRVVIRGYTVDNPEEYAWSRNKDRFAIVLWELQFRNGTPGNVLLKIDFKKMEMEIIEEFDRNNLLGEE